MVVDILELAQTAPPEIRQKFQQREYSEGDCIISPAAMPTCCLYIVLSGLLEVQKESGGGNAIVVNTFSAGDVFGEVEIFSPEYKPYAVRVKTACRILVLDKETVFQWMREVFDFDLFLCEMLTRRMVPDLGFHVPHCPFAHSRTGAGVHLELLQQGTAFPPDKRGTGFPGAGALAKRQSCGSELHTTGHHRLPKKVLCG